MSDKKLTINVVTYNHENYISECLDSILMQKTSFDYVIRIFEDASSDKTQDICKEYAKKYSNIELYLANEHMGIQNNELVNARRAYDNIKTPYYIFIEGDDYYCSDSAFQQEFDILEKHPECSFVCAGTKVYENDTKYMHEEFYYPKLGKSIYTLEDIRNSQIYIQSLIGSRMVRTDAININPEYSGAYTLDITQICELLKSGNMYFIDSPICVYRITTTGFFRGQNFSNKFKFIFNSIMKYNEYTNYEFEEFLMFFMTTEYEGLLERKRTNNFNQEVNNFTPKRFFSSYIKRFRRYFIPRFILDIFDLPRDISRLIRRYISKRSVNEFK